MRTSFPSLLLLPALLLCAPPAHSAFRAGASMRVVTPDPLLPVIGGIGKAEPVQKKMGDLTVRALVLDKEGTTVAIVGADFLGFPGILCDRVRSQIQGIPKENILIGATHTHSAPDLFGFSVEEGKSSADLQYIDWVCAQMVEAIREAQSKLEPASVKIRTGKAQGKIAYNYYAPQLYDQRMSVIQCISKATQKPIATLVNYATHPEVLGDSAGILSPDIIGPMDEHIESQGGGMALFMNSAQGGMVTADCRGPDDQDVGTWEECVRIGTLMANESLRIVAGAPVQEDPGLFCGAATIRFPLDSDMVVEVLQSSPLGFKLGEDKTVGAQVNVVNLGTAQILTIPGEALPNIGFYLKRKMHGKDNFLFGLTNDEFGYILTKVDYDSFDRYKYISETSFGEMTGEILIEEALKFVDACPRPQE